MRSHPTLDALFTAPRQGILATTLTQPGRWWYLSDLARHLGLHHATLQRELARLTQAQILESRRDGNRVYYRANADSPVFPELRALLAKTAGLAGVLQSALAPHTPHIECAFVYGSVARGAEAAESDVDLMIVGSVTLMALSKALATAERELQRPVEASVYGVADFAHKVASANPFVRRVLSGDKLFVVGTERDLERLAQGGASRAAPARTRRDRGTKKGR